MTNTEIFYSMVILLGSAVLVWAVLKMQRLDRETRLPRS